MSGALDNLCCCWTLGKLFVLRPELLHLPEQNHLWLYLVILGMKKILLPLAACFSQTLLETKSSITSKFFN